MIEFIEDGHIYLYEGVTVPSVSEIVRFELDEYKDVPQWILDRAAEYGTKVHEMVESIESGLSLEEFNEMPIDFFAKYSVNEYVSLKNYEVESMEQMIGNKHCCGRYDILTKDGYLVDIKTNSKYPQRHLEIQLGLYYWLMGMEKDKAYCMWLPKRDKARLVEVKPITNKECEDIIARYEKRNSD